MKYQQSSVSLFRIYRMVTTDEAGTSRSIPSSSSLLDPFFVPPYHRSRGVAISKCYGRHQLIWWLWWLRYRWWYPSTFFSFCCWRRCITNSSSCSRKRKRRRRRRRRCMRSMTWEGTNLYLSTTTSHLVNRCDVVWCGVHTKIYQPAADSMVGQPSAT